MSNRAERRASAKIARQAVKRAKSPTEGAILRAAAGFAADGLVGQLGACLSNADFDDAWGRLADDLHDILAERFSEFLTAAYAEAGLGILRAAGSGRGETEMGTRLFLCPVSGPQDRLSAFSNDAGEIGRLESSLREFGVVPEDGRCLVAPLVLPLEAFASEATPPGRVRALHDELADRLTERLSGSAPPARGGIRDVPAELREEHPITAGTDIRFGALIGIELIPDPHAGEADVTEAEDMARAAAVDSWYDSYAADIPDMAIGAPLDWPACAAALAWETIRIPIAAALSRRGAPEGRPAILHCGPSDDGERLVVSAVSGGVAVGPFSAPSSLVWLDADEFFARAEAGAETFEEHDNERDVIAPLLGRAPGG